MYLYERPPAPQRLIVPDGRSRWSHLCGLEAPRAGTLVLYVTPANAEDKRNKRVWGFAVPEGRREYEKALHTHLVAQNIVPAKGTTYEPMTGSADIAALASNAFEDLVLIVHSAHNGPAIGVNLGAADWLKDDKVGNVLAPLAYNKVTILGCDAVENKFAPNLAARLPKGSTIVAHKGGAFVIGRHFEPSKTKPGWMSLTRVSSNFKLKSFKGGQ